MKDRLLPVLKNILSYIKKAWSVLEVRYLVCAVFTVIFAEILSVGPVGGVSYPFRHPIAFICAAAILFCSFTVASFSPCKLGVFLIIEAFWLGIAIANKVLLSYRVNPLSAADFAIIKSAFSIIPLYLSGFQIILISVAIAAAIALAVFAMIRLPKKKPNFKRSAVVSLISAGAVVLLSLTTFSAYSSNMRKMKLPEAYEEYGFVYSLSMSVTDRGIVRPEGYSKQNITTLLRPDETDGGDDYDPTLRPANGKANVIFVQLESFFDPYLIKDVSISSDAIPNFRNLKMNYPSGSFTVPVSGGGTVNTEFEVLCGIPLSVFGIGEYPYETVLLSSPCESLAYYFTAEGYTSHAIHNHTGTFYNRHIVLENLGFDTFTPIEYMSHVRENSLGWAKDKILCDEIMGAVKSTESSDFVYAISVQPHGKYVSVPGDYGDIKVTGSYSDETLCSIEYYVNQLCDTDAFVGELVKAAEALDEDTVIVFFGDHQPSFELTADCIKSETLYETEYVIWSNFDLEAEDEPLDAYRIGAHVLDLLGIEGGVISGVHNGKYGSDVGEDVLMELAYDILMGEKWAYGGEFPYDVPDISFGWQKVKTYGAYIRNDTLYVTGENFTESSVVYIGGRRRNTIYIDENLIVCDNVSAAVDVKVCQVAESGFVFGEVKCKMISQPE